MIYKRLTILSVLLVACRSGTSPSGSCTNAVASGGLDANVQVLEGVPAGGYVAFGDRGCTATFSLLSADAQSIRLNAFTAHHCSRDDKADNEKISVAVYFPPSGAKSGFYLKNLIAHDEFYERRAAYINAVRGLNNSRASFIAESLSKIPSFGVWFRFSLPSATPDPTQENINRNICLIRAKTDETFKSSNYKNCWSVFDTGLRVLELRKADLGENNFQLVAQHLTKKSQEQKAILDKNPQLSQQLNFWSGQIQGRMGGFRLLNYVKLAAFLNQDICGKYIPDASPDKVACAVRQNLIDLSSKYLVETDTDGRKKNVFDKARELGLPINSPIPLSEFDQPFKFTDIQDEMESRADKDFIKKFNETIMSVGALLPVKNYLLGKLPPNLTIATNISPSNGKSGASYFGVASFNAIHAAPQGINALGVSEYTGVMKLYLNASQTKLSFSKGDSGSMLSIAGMVPLLALNTVNDEPTSGGASILALPEASGEEEAAVSSIACN